MRYMSYKMAGVKCDICHAKMAGVQCDIFHTKWLGCNVIYVIQNGWIVM